MQCSNLPKETRSGRKLQCSIFTTIRYVISYADATVRTFFTLRAQYHEMDYFSRCYDAMRGVER